MIKTKNDKQLALIITYDLFGGTNVSAPWTAVSLKATASIDSFSWDVHD